MTLKEIALKKHAEWQGKLSVEVKEKIWNREDLSIAYTPGVAYPCLEIEKNEADSYRYTGKGNTVAVITDGSAVLGLGDIGASAGMPVMEGKCALFKTFANIDAIPICINTNDVDEIVETVYRISKSFGGINLEDISAPRCFEIEKRLIEKCDIPVFHDDQHGTAIVTCAGILNAIKLTGKKAGELQIVISGAGSAGISIAKMILRMRLGEVILSASHGIIYEGATFNNEEQEKIAAFTNRKKKTGNLSDALKNADILIGVSKPGLVTEDDVKSMKADPIIFAMSNPTPEIMPDEALRAGAAVVGTGRSDFPNQVNNVLAFPGIFRGALDSRARNITEEMNMEAAKAIAAVIPADKLRSDYVLPDVFDGRVVKGVAKAVSDVVKQGTEN